MGPGLPWLLCPIQGLKLLSPALIMYHHTDQHSEGNVLWRGVYHGTCIPLPCPCLEDNGHLAMSNTPVTITDTLPKPFLQVCTLVFNLKESNFPPTENPNLAPRAQTWGSWKDVTFYIGVCGTQQVPAPSGAHVEPSPPSDWQGSRAESTSTADLP